MQEANWTLLPDDFIFLSICRLAALDDWCQRAAYHKLPHMAWVPWTCVVKVTENTVGLKGMFVLLFLPKRFLELALSVAHYEVSANDFKLHS